MNYKSIDFVKIEMAYMKLHKYEVFKKDKNIGVEVQIRHERVSINVPQCPLNTAFIKEMDSLFNMTGRIWIDNRRHNMICIVYEWRDNQ